MVASRLALKGGVEWGAVLCLKNMDASDIQALPIQTHWRRRKAAEQRELLSAEHYRACWELPRRAAAGQGRVPGVEREAMGRHRGDGVGDGYRSLVHL